MNITKKEYAVLKAKAALFDRVAEIVGAVNGDNETTLVKAVGMHTLKHFGRCHAELTTIN